MSFKHALDLIAQGIPVFPCRPDKKPYTENGYKDATTDPDQVNEWLRQFPDALIGVPTGERTGWTVLDLDTEYPKGTPSTIAFEWYADHMAELATPYWHNTQRGGKHLFFKWNGERNAGAIRPAVDIRGEGGYIIWWPAEGCPAGDPEDRINLPTMPELPPGAYGSNRPVPRIQQGNLGPEGFDATRHTPRGTNLVDVANGAPGGSRNETLAEVTGTLLAKGLEPVVVRGLMRGWAMQCQPPMDPIEAATTVENIIRREGEQPPPPPVFSVVHRDTEPEDARFILEHYLPIGVVTVMGGTGGAGKSSQALIWAAHAAVARSWNGLPVRKSRVLFVSAEDAPGMVMFRLRKICAAYQLDLDAVLENLTIVDGSSAFSTYLAVEQTKFGVHELVPTPAFDELKHLADDHDLVILDNASDLYGGNEIDRRQVRRFIRGMLATLAKELDAAVLLLVHIDKAAARGNKKASAGHSYSGSTQWHDGARSRIALVKDDKDQLHLEHEKANYRTPQKTVYLTWGDDGVLMPTNGGGVTDDDVDASVDALAFPKREQAILEAMQQCAEAGITVPWATNVAYGPAKTLAATKVFKDTFGKGRDGRDLGTDVIHQMLKSKKLRITTWRDGKHDKQCLVIAGVPEANPGSEMSAASEMDSKDTVRGGDGNGAGFRDVPRCPTSPIPPTEMSEHLGPSSGDSGSSPTSSDIPTSRTISDHLGKGAETPTREGKYANSGWGAETMSTIATISTHPCPRCAGEGCDYCGDRGTV